MASQYNSTTGLGVDAGPVRLQDVAAEAGVSLATADRVLNGRAGVRERTAQKVHAAVQRLAYRPDPSAARLARARPWRLAFLLPEGNNSFVAALRGELDALAPWLVERRARAQVTLADEFSPTAAAKAIAALAGQADAAVLMCQDHPLVRHAIEELAARGTTVVTLVSDVPIAARAHFVGIDNVAAGRTAGTLVGRFVPRPRHGRARVGVVLGSRWLRDHAERLFGFQQVLDAEHPHIELIDPLEGRDRSDLTEPLVRSLLERVPDLAGLYSIGAGNRGIASALKSAGAAGRVVWVCHELTAHARLALLEGTAAAVINQSAAREVRSACRLALTRLTRGRPLPDEGRIRIEVFLKDNLP
jgi:LacI family transcriptional regulator